ncbi:MAG TPA: hypothetical protein VLA34_10425 [Candidatus Krumholzibacterium sp.]|nr:hypothetical protein [Candidatus Krumholzibacterium sp.]
MRLAGRSFLLIAGVVLMISFLCAEAADAGVGLRIGARGIRMDPEGDDAEDYSRPGWGGGLYALVVPENPLSLFAGIIGFDFVNLLDQTTEYIDQTTMLRIEQQTSQNYIRLYIGGRLGHQGNGFFRPYAEANIAMINYGIKTDVVIPDDVNPDNEIRQHLDDENRTVFGYDVTLGLELKASRLFFVDIGAKYLKSFGVVQQLSGDAVEVHPQYIMYFIGMNFRLDI